MPQPLEVVADSKLMFRVGAGADTDSKFGRFSTDGSLDPQ
jgi:hypothetical protein